MRKIIVVIVVMSWFSTACMQVAWATTTYDDVVMRGDTATPEPTQPKPSIATATFRADDAESCTVATGIENGTLHVRVCGSTRCPPVLWLKEGQRVDVISWGEWVMVRVGEYVGYANAKFIVCRDGATK